MKKDFVIFLVLISLFIIPIVLSASLSFDKAPANYNLLDTVYITGTGFTYYEQVGIEIRDPSNTVVFANQTTVNSSGMFTNKYPIPDNGATGPYTIYASTRFETAQNTFTVLVDTEKPRWSSFQNYPVVVTILDDAKINVTWYDNVNLNKVLIWENSTGNWVSHSVGG
jgi:hypothetical protein